jgi:hypothetical protein
VERKNKERGKKLEGLYVGPRFCALVPFEILGASTLGLPALGGPSNPEGTRCKTFSYTHTNRVVCKHLQ